MEVLDQEVLNLYWMYPIDELERFLDSQKLERNSEERKVQAKQWVLQRNADDSQFLEQRKEQLEYNENYIKKIRSSRFSEKYELILKHKLKPL